MPMLLFMTIYQIQLFLKNAKASCSLVNAGKRLGFKAMSQDQNKQKIISLAKKGIGTVVRLKGGDPLQGMKKQNI